MKINGLSPQIFKTPERALVIKQTSDLLLIIRIRISLRSSAVRILCVCINNLRNYENVDTEPSLKMHKLPSVCPFFWGGGGGGGGQGIFFWKGGGW